ncbi:MAG: hypothetical protein RL095_656 [Verrucomicrobiota bacterium]|jgi:phosphoglycolate phosphatase-like HAD superfamily hydrolase
MRSRELLAKAGVRLPKVIAVDWDGTLSTLRQGGPRVLRAFLAEAFREAGLDPESHPEAIRHFVHGAAGSTAHTQARKMSQLLESLGGRPFSCVERAGDALSRGYEQRCLARLKWRPRRWLLPGALGLLRDCRRHGIAVHLVTGSPQVSVEEEIRRLRLLPYFTAVHGASPGDGPDFKRLRFESIAARHGIPLCQLGVVGDGPGEMRAGQALGCPLVGIAIEESRHHACEVKARILRDLGVVLITDRLCRVLPLLSQQMKQEP